MRAFLLALFLGLAFPVAASADTWVDQDSLGGPCSDTRTAAEASSPSTPWCSLNRAVKAAPAASKVVVRQATYPALVVDGDSSRSDYLTFRAADGEQPSGILNFEDTSHLHVEGFRLRYITWLTRVEHIRLKGNEITPNGVVVREGSFLDFEGNDFHDIEQSSNATAAGYAIRLATGPVSDVRVVNNRFDRVTADGVQAGSTTRLLIEDNEFSRINAWDNPNEHADAIQFYGTVTDATVRRNWTWDSNKFMMLKGKTYRGLVVENNLVHDTLQGLNLYDVPGAKIVNNTIWTARTFAVRLRSQFGDMSDIVAANNIFEEFEGRSLVTTDVANLVGGDPLFAADGSYELTAESPAIDAASATYAPETDRLGRSRVGSPDIGAHEYQGASEPEPDPPTASYTYSPPAPVTGEPVTFDASNSTCPAAPCSYVWEGDGPDGPGGTQWPLGEGETLTFTFQDAGEKHVRLIVTDAQGRTDETVQTVTVASSSCG